MIADDLFRGELVRLVACEPEELARAASRWHRNTVYQRLLDTDPAAVFSVASIQKWLEKEAEASDGARVGFQMRRLSDERMIGYVNLYTGSYQHRDAWVGIGIGEADCWGQGYGTEAMRLVLRYAFMELNQHRVSLGVFAYNPRAIRSYEKAGFRREGVQRRYLHRDGEFADIVYMGILQSEWMELYAQH